MKTVSMVVCDRPLYTAQALAGVAKSLLDLGEGEFDKLLVSIDRQQDGSINGEVAEVCEKAMEVISKAGIVECYMYENVVKMGIGGNHIVALQRAFEEHVSDFNVMVEDDVVLTVDAIGLADWFYENYGGPTSDYLLLSLAHHRAFGRGDNPGGIPDDPSFLVEAQYLNSPFAWAASKFQWPYIKATWNRKELPPNGWDWALSYYMGITKRKALNPVVSRCRNIGRLGGRNESPESFDATQADLLHSDGSYVGDYSIVGKIPHTELVRMDWMDAEYRRMLSK